MCSDYSSLVLYLLTVFDNVRSGPSSQTLPLFFRFIHIESNEILHVL